jgi:hypothetical protein
LAGGVVYELPSSAMVRLRPPESARSYGCASSGAGGATQFDGVDSRG